MLVESTRMLSYGSPAPDFNLRDVTSSSYVNRDSLLAGKKGMLVIFLCNHCPYVVNIEKELATVTASFMKQGISVVGISSNDVVACPADSPTKMVEKAEKVGYEFPYCFDADQSVAIAYCASCAPEFFLFNADGKLVYNGRFCASMPKREKDKTRNYWPSPETTGDELKKAVELLLEDKTIPLNEQITSKGCNIKWLIGKEPGYFIDKRFYVETARE
eukprot:GSMAST32.ASY1.ANO1.1897.1 assembled CDS